MPKLHRGENFVSADGTVHRARLERKPKDVKKLGNWDWFDNPFLGTAGTERLASDDVVVEQLGPEETNNSIDEVDGERRYVVSRRGRHVRKYGQ